MSNPLIMVFVRNPELGRVKTRLAKSIGDQAALETYKILSKHTSKIINEIDSDQLIFYSDKIQDNDIWTATNCKKQIQTKGDLGQKMLAAFQYGFSLGYQKILIIGSDLYSLRPKHIESAFEQLENYDVVIGPVLDGGYYLLGLNFIIPKIFKQKQWSTSSVLKETLSDLKEFNVNLLEPLNDIDTYEDLKKEPQLLKQLNI
ncbi:MAG: TIGR04282 family arsenosugar biosynthesis glycosyltransferase [Bacteroidetes bacterium]|nr:TIGR04282 family arsenosugar biosynthesis glycosyltransferase [Bacteroidota bacterium]MDA0860864.1 TIGR04282 family arsenosugar biosynthesis glycosyltransferase [Bacteroidota bacterium]MDA1318749.1 TIGR04282 family arsenosugar biosynthesis glycosyltransferase [Bacteroidota bacterium]